MTGKEFKRVLDAIENEGFEYAFVNYAEFEDVKDKDFHQLRKAYLDARKELAEYVGFEE